MEEASVHVVFPETTTRRRGRRVLRLWFAHNSGRFDRPDRLWAAAITKLRRKAGLITGTEAAGRDGHIFKWALRGTDWAYAHLTGAAEAECYATWDTSVLGLTGKPFAHKLTDLTWVRSPEYGGKKAAKVHALVLRLRVIATGQTYWVVVWHAPLDNTDARAAAWVDSCAGLVDLKAHLHDVDRAAEVIIVGDVNKNLRLHNEAGAVRQHLEKPLGMVTSWAGGLPRNGGTHDNQVIDYALLPRAILAGCQLLKDLPDSDHRAFRYRLRRRTRP